MGLLNTLGLKPSRKMVRDAAVQAARDNPTDPKDLRAGSLPAAGMPMAMKKATANTPQDPPFAAADADDPTRAAAQAQRQLLLARERQAREVVQQIAAIQHQRAEALKKALPSSRASIEASKKKADQALDEAARRHEQVRQDLKLLDDPTARREDLVQLLARAQSKAGIAALDVVDTTGGAAGQDLNERKQVITRTAFKDGEAAVDKETRSLRVDGDGVTHSKKDEQTRVWAEGSAKLTQEQILKAGPDGLSVERKQAAEVEGVDAKGERVKVSTESSQTASLGPGGVKRGESQKATAADGSSIERSGERAIERGGGKLGVSETNKFVATDADGNSLERQNSGKANIVADGKNFGAGASTESGVSKTGKDGVSRGVVGGLHAQVHCSIGDPQGEPPRYPVTVEVNLGADITITAGKAKEGAPGKASAEIKLGADYFLRETRMLPPDELQTYVFALQEASKGGTANATYKEMAIVQAGVRQGWQVAQMMAKQGGKPLSAAMLAQLKNAGDATEVATSKTAGAKLSGNLKAVNVEVGAQNTQERSTKVTRNQNGGLDVAASASDEEKYSAKLGLNMGLVGASIGGSHTVKTGFGFEITVDPDMDKDGRILAALAACESEAQYKAFLARHGKQVRVKTITRTAAVSDSQSVGMSLAGAEASIGLQAGVAEEIKVDAQGKLVSGTVVGEAGAGGGMAVGGLGWGDSGKSQAVARFGGDGEASLDLNKTQSRSTIDKTVDLMSNKVKGKVKAAKSLLGLGEDGVEQKGVGTVLAGGGGEEEDNQVRDVFGLRLGPKDLDAIGKRAESDSAWTPRAGNAEDIKAWRAAGARIRAVQGVARRAAVADELARFVGGSKSQRLQQLRLFLRPGGDVSIGRAYSFPDSLAKHRKAFDELVLDDCEARVADALARSGAEKALTLGRDLLARVEALRNVINTSQEFSDKAAQADMLSALARRRTALAEAIRIAEGKDSEADRKAAAVAAFGRLMSACAVHQIKQNELFEKINEELDGRKQIRALEFGDFAPLIKQLQDVRAIWQRDLSEAVALAKANDIPERRYLPYQPNEPEFQRLKTACRM